jgi:hypothetical protein
VPSTRQTRCNPAPTLPSPADSEYNRAYVMGMAPERVDRLSSPSGAGGVTAHPRTHLPAIRPSDPNIRRAQREREAKAYWDSLTEAQDVWALRKMGYFKIGQSG